MTSLRVLITQLHLDLPHGSETHTYTLAVGLRARGHTPVVYTPVAGDLRERFLDAQIPILDSLTEVAKDDFDIIHAHHNAVAMTVRSLLPSTAMVFSSHGVLPEVERPPSLDCNIQTFIAASDEVAAMLRNSVAPVHTLGNPIDTGRFRPARPIREQPSTALVFSSRIDAATLDTIQHACRSRGITVDVLGLPRSPLVWNTNEILQRYDIVFGIGRSALEAMACERAVFLLDYQGSDGWVTRDTFPEVRKHNFSGRRYAEHLDWLALAQALSGYDVAMGPQNRDLVMRYHSLDEFVTRLEAIYEDSIARFENKQLVLPGRELRLLHGELSSRFRRERSHSVALANELDMIKGSLVWRLFVSLRQRFFSSGSSGEALIQICKRLVSRIQR